MEQSFFILNATEGRTTIQHLALRETTQGIYFALFGFFSALWFLTWIEIMEKIRSLGEVTTLLRMRVAVVVGLIIVFLFEMIVIPYHQSLPADDPVKQQLQVAQPLVAGLYC